MYQYNASGMLILKTVTEKENIINICYQKKKGLNFNLNLLFLVSILKIDTVFDQLLAHSKYMCK